MELNGGDNEETKLLDVAADKFRLAVRKRANPQQVRAGHRSLLVLTICLSYQLSTILKVHYSDACGWHACCAQLLMLYFENCRPFNIAPLIYITCN